MSALRILSARPSRRGQLQQLLSFLDEQPLLPKAILGDFNSSPIWPVYRRLAARLTDAAAAVAPDSGPRPTWPHFPWLGIRGLIRIDHCFLTTGLSALSARVVPVRGSDHLGLCVDVRLDDGDPRLGR